MRFIRPMSSLETIRQGFAVWKIAPFRLSLINLPAMFTRSMLFFMIQFSLLLFFSQFRSNLMEGLVFIMITAIVIIPTALVLLLSINYLPNLAMVAAASNAVLGRPVSIRQAYRRAFSWTIFRKYILIMLASWVIILGGLLLLGIIAAAVAVARDPAVFADYDFFLSDTLDLIKISYIIFFSLATTGLDISMFLLLPVLVLEKRAPAQTIRRVRTFLREFGGHILLTYLLAYFIPFVLPNLLNNAFSSSFLNIQSGFWACTWFIYIFFYLFFSSVGTIVMLLSYYDIRSRREHYDEQVLAEEMGYRPLAEMIVP